MTHHLSEAPRMAALCLLAGIAATFPAHATSLTAGLIGYYTFDNQNFVSSYGQSNTGTARGAVTFGSGVGSTFYAMSVSASPRSGGVDLPARPFAQTRSLSIAFWFYPGATQRTEYSAMIYRKTRREDGYETDRAYAVWWIAGGVHVVYTPKGADVQYVCTNQSFGLAPETWHHFALTLDSRTQLARVYLDGKRVKTCPYAGGRLARAPRELVLGDLPIGYHDMPEAGPFTGSLDDVRFYTRPLSSAEVQELYTDIE